MVSIRLHTFQNFASFESVGFKVEMLEDMYAGGQDETRDHNVAEDRVSITRKTGLSVRNDENT